MPRANSTVAQRRNYRVHDVAAARSIVRDWLSEGGFDGVVSLGLPEIDDRYHVWRVPLVSGKGSDRLGEVVLNARTGDVVAGKSTAPEIVRKRVAGNSASPEISLSTDLPPESPIVCGDAATVLRGMKAESVHLVFTSPPYYNARPEYRDYATYDAYLEAMRAVLREAHRVLAEGRFFVMNVAPILIRRTGRSRASTRIAVPFDMHRLFIEEGYDFVDDIVWEKPEGAGWATGRGRRFAADRHPLQYKPVPVTEYVLVYRKHTDRLIDWNIRTHHDAEAVSASRIDDGYERTNVWRIKPAHDKRHPAVFPVELAERVIRYYSFRGDTVLDPFAGIGTTGRAAARLGRRYVLIDQNPDYVAVMRDGEPGWGNR